MAALSLVLMTVHAGLVQVTLAGRTLRCHKPSCVLGPVLGD